MNLKQVSTKRLAYALAYEISKSKSESHAQRYVNYYILQNIINGLFQFIIILLISYFLGVFVEGLVCSIVFSSIRLFSGGYHAKTYKSCLLYTTVIITSISLLSHYIYLHNYYSTYINLILFLFCIGAIYKNSPCSNRHIQTISKNKQKKLIRRSLLTTIFWFTISIYLIINNLYLNIIPAIGISAFTVGLLLIICINYNSIKVNNCA